MDVVGLGNPLIDVLVEVQEDLLRSHNLEKGIMRLASQQEADQMLSALSSYSMKITPGDSTANTLAGIAKLGGKTAFFGKVGDDEHGAYYKKDLEDSSVIPKLTVAQGQTGTVLALITPDAERTMLVHLGVACQLKKEDLCEDTIKSAKFLHLTGYQLEDPTLKETAFHAMSIAKANGIKISLDLADPSLVARNKEFLLEVAQEYVDILFANEEEAKAFVHADPATAVHLIAEIVDIAVVKIGAQGSLVKQGGIVHSISAVPAKAVDTTGAGDNYAAGFLYGLAQGLTIEKAGELGSRTAAKVVAQVGARLQEKVMMDG